MGFPIYYVLFKSALHQPHAGEGAGHHLLKHLACRDITYRFPLGSGISLDFNPWGRAIITPGQGYHFEVFFFVFVYEAV